MVAVPDAIRKVLEVTAQTILSKSNEDRYDVVPSNATPTELLGRILAEDVRMVSPGYPPYRASIMDGYAIQCESYEANADRQWSHQVSGRVHAGPSLNESGSSPSEGSKTDNVPSAVYVTTGARIPDAYDCVVPIEQIMESDDKSNIKIAPTATVEPGKWIRGVGCDIEPGSLVLQAGSVIKPVSMGLLQQSGQPQVKLLSPIKVGVLSTGNELLVSTHAWANEAHTTGGLIQTGQIPDVNKPILLSLIASFGNCQPIDLGMERDDDIDSMTKTIETALKTCDVILTTGGISMGETDIVEDVLVKRLGGTLHFGRLNMKPGKPTTFVSIKRNGSRSPTLVFALPGNPVSATVCTHLLVQPSLNMLKQYWTDEVKDVVQMVQNTMVHAEVSATLAHDVKLDMERPEYHRVVLEMKMSSTGGTDYVASSTDVQRSSRLMSLRDAEGLLVLPKGTTDQPRALAGQAYTVLLMDTTYATLSFQKSKHLNPKKERPPTKVGITQVLEGTGAYPPILSAEISDRVQRALSGSRSGSVKVIWCEEVTGHIEKVRDHFSQPNAEAVDVWVVACSASFLYSLDISKCIRERIGKVADAMALQARQGAASQDGTAALFEPVVGFLDAGPLHDGCMLIALPASGLEGGLSNVRGLLKHAVNVAREMPHNHHHKLSSQ